MKCYIGLDLGTSGCRGIAIDEQAEVIAEFASPLPEPDSPRPGEHQQMPDLWWHAVVEILRRLVQACNHDQVEAIAVDGTSSTLLLCDELGRPLAPALMYNDSQCREQAKIIGKLAPPNSAAHGSSSGLAKLLYLYQLHPQASHALAQADWIAAQLSGRFYFSDANNALKSGYDVLNLRPGFSRTTSRPAGPVTGILMKGDTAFGLHLTTASGCGLITIC